MRIISGKLKGKLINFFVSNSTTRPLKDSVKENIFNILKHSNYINKNRGCKYFGSLFRYWVIRNRMYF